MKTENVATSAQRLELSELNGATDAKAPLFNDLNPLHKVRAQLQVVVGTVDVSVGELLAAKAHQVIRLDQRLDQPVDLMLEGKVVARGELMAVGENFAIRITELPVALTL